MLTRAALALMLLPLCACKPTEDSHMKAIIGAVLIDGEGGPPVSNSVVVVAGDRIRAAGAASTVPIPAEADKIDGSGKFLVPALVEVSSGVRISSLTEVESQVKNGASAFIGMIRDTESSGPGIPGDAAQPSSRLRTGTGGRGRSRRRRQTKHAPPVPGRSADRSGSRRPRPTARNRVTARRRPAAARCHRGSDAQRHHSARQTGQPASAIGQPR